jgi:proteasome assembly chaperone 2
VIVLTSLDIATAAEDESVIMSPWRSLLPPNVKSDDERIARLKEIPSYLSSTAPDPLREDSISASTTQAYPPPLPAGGLCGPLLENLQHNGEGGSVPPHGALCAWCAEGDNRGDAFGMAGVLAFVLGLGEVVLTPLFPG